jgi:hypothetical protein
VLGKVIFRERWGEGFVMLAAFYAVKFSIVNARLQVSVIQALCEVEDFLGNLKTRKPTKPNETFVRLLLTALPLSTYLPILGLHLHIKGPDLSQLLFHLFFFLHIGSRLPRTA